MGRRSTRRGLVRAIRLVVVVLAVLLALGTFDGYWVPTLVFLAVVLGLPVDSVVARLTAGVVAVGVLVVVTGEFPRRIVFYVVDDTNAEYNLPYQRAFVAGALLGEALHAVVRALRRRSA
jgi:hypothetical protein